MAGGGAGGGGGEGRTGGESSHLPSQRLVHGFAFQQFGSGKKKQFSPDEAFSVSSHHTVEMFFNSRGHSRGQQQFNNFNIFVSVVGFKTFVLRWLSLLPHSKEVVGLIPNPETCMWGKLEIHASVTVNGCLTVCGPAINWQLVHLFGGNAMHVFQPKAPL